MDSHGELCPIYSKQPCENGFTCTLRLPPNPVVKATIIVNYYYYIKNGINFICHKLLFTVPGMTN
jgi:hypothetical protein